MQNSGFKIESGRGRGGARVVAALVLATGLLIAGACRLPFTDTVGTLEVDVGSISTLSLLPDVDMNVTGYVLTGSGPDGESFERSTTGGTVRVSELTTGTWTVEAVGSNADGIDIAAGSGQTRVAPGETSQLSVTVTPYDGQGTLSVSVTWPEAEVSSPGVSADLVAADGTVQPLSFSLEGSGSAFQQPLQTATGYYTLSVQLYDGDAVVAGAAESARIANSATTSGTIAFTDINQPSGDTDIVIDPELDDPLQVTISGAVAELVLAAGMTVSASTANAEGETVTYTWYVNGGFVAAGSGLTIGSELPPGAYRLDVVAFTADGSRSGSASHVFSVVE